MGGPWGHPTPDVQMLGEIPGDRVCAASVHEECFSLILSSASFYYLFLRVHFGGKEAPVSFLELFMDPQSCCLLGPLFSLTPKITAVRKGNSKLTLSVYLLRFHPLYPTATPLKLRDTCCVISALILHLMSLANEGWNLLRRLCPIPSSSSSTPHFCILFFLFSHLCLEPWAIPNKHSETKTQANQKKQN